MLFSKKIIGAAIVAFSIFINAPAYGASVRSVGVPAGAPAVSSGLDLGLEVIGVTKTPAGSFVILQDSKTGKRGVYKAGSIVKGAKIIEVNREDVVFEREGATEAVSLRKSAAVKQSQASMPGVPDGEMVASPEAFPGAAGPESFTFDPVTSATGPAGEGGDAPELPYFEPITNDTGPVAPVPEGYEPKELPEFTPLENMTGPVAE